MDYKKVELGDRDRLQKYFTAAQQWLAEYTFSTVLAWGCGGIEYRYRIEDDTLYMLVVEKIMGNSALLKPISLEKTFSPKELQALMRNENTDTMICVDSNYYGSFEKNEWEKYFAVTEDTGWSNYYYSNEELSELKGGRFSGKRNLIKQFRENYGSRDIEVKACSAPVIKDCLQLHDEWYRKRGGYDGSMLEREQVALATSLDNFKELGLSGAGMFVEGRLRAFCIYERLNEKTMVVHFEKTANEFKGLPQFFVREVAGLVKHKYGFMNREGDMNDEGLKRAKRSLNPVFMVKSMRLKTGKGVDN